MPTPINSRSSLKRELVLVTRSAQALQKALSESYDDVDFYANCEELEALRGIYKSLIALAASYGVLGVFTHHLLRPEKE